MNLGHHLELALEKYRNAFFILERGKGEGLSPTASELGKFECGELWNSHLITSLFLT